MDNSNERMRILELIEGGKITTEEGLRLLSELPDVSEIEADAAEQVETAPDVIFGATASTADADGFPAGEPAARDQSYQNGATSQASSEPIQPEVLPRISTRLGALEKLLDDPFMDRRRRYRCRWAADVLGCRGFRDRILVLLCQHTHDSGCAIDCFSHPIANCTLASPASAAVARRKTAEY